METKGANDSDEGGDQRVHVSLFATATSGVFFNSEQVDDEPGSLSSSPVFVPKKTPDWLGPDDEVVGAAVPVTPVLIVHTPHVSIVLESVTAYPTGVTFEIAMRLRRGDWDDDQWDEAQEAVFHHHHHHRRRRGQADLLVGVSLVDGSRAVSAGDWHRWPDNDDPPTPPVLLERGSGGGSSSGVTISSSRGFWLWPLPEGDLTIVIAWPTFDIPEHSVTVPAGPMTDAAAHSINAWP